MNANTHRALGCVGTITDGAVRDLDEMTNAGFKALAKRLCVGHAHVTPIEWGCDVEVFGQTIVPGQLVHADKHGFLAIPPGEEKGLLDASVFMDQNECNTVIRAARGASGLTESELITSLNQAGKDFGKAAKEKFGDAGEFGLNERLTDWLDHQLWHMRQRREFGDSQGDVSDVCRLEYRGAMFGRGRQWSVVQNWRIDFARKNGGHRMPFSRSSSVALVPSAAMANLLAL